MDPVEITVANDARVGPENHGQQNDSIYAIMNTIKLIRLIRASQKRGFL